MNWESVVIEIGMVLLLVLVLKLLALVPSVFTSNLVGFTVLALASGEILLKASEITVLVKIAKILTVTFNAYILE